LNAIILSKYPKKNCKNYVSNFYARKLYQQACAKVSFVKSII
jgi:hypothetical protein